MSARFSIFVEGPEDEKFIDCLLRHIGINNIEIKLIRGAASNLWSIRNQISREYENKEGRVAILVDADKDVDTRRQEVRDSLQKIKRGAVHDSEFFLVPDNENPGCLETLLGAIAADKHQVVHKCFELYEECLKNQSESYSAPDLKTKIYAYCEALGTEPKPLERDYENSDFWNLDAPQLEPLKEFLRKFLKGGI